MELRSIHNQTPDEHSMLDNDVIDVIYGEQNRSLDSVSNDNSENFNLTSSNGIMTTANSLKSSTSMEPQPVKEADNAIKLKVRVPSQKDPAKFKLGKDEQFKKLFEAEQRDLIFDLLQLPRNSAVRKINELVKRARLVRTHMYILSHLKNKMPILLGKESTQKELTKNLLNEYKEIERTKKIPLGDFPDVAFMQQKLARQLDFSIFPPESDRLNAMMERVLTMDLPQLMKLIQPPKEKGEIITNPFAEIPWDIKPDDKATFDEIFFSLGPKNGKITGNVARDTLVNTGIDLGLLRKIWELSDFEKDGVLDSDEFALALYLTEVCKRGGNVPDVLPLSLIPPSKRKYVTKK